MNPNTKVPTEQHESAANDPAASATLRPISSSESGNATKETSVHPSEEFLREYLKDAREEMNWRRDLEMRLLQYMFVFYPVIATAMVTLYQTPIKQEVYWWLAAGAIIFIVAATAFATQRIIQEHKNYAGIGRIVVKIWSYYGLFEPRVYLENGSILPESLKNPDTGFGQGPGYIRSLLLTWTVTLAVIMVILALAFFKVP